MAKVGISTQEFDNLCAAFKAPKEGAHIKWREFVDAVDEVFTKKGLEKNLDIEVRNVDNMRHSSWVLRFKTNDKVLILLDCVSCCLDIIVALVNVNRILSIYISGKAIENRNIARKLNIIQCESIGCEVVT